MPRKGTKARIFQGIQRQGRRAREAYPGSGIDLQMCLRGFAAQELFRPEPVVGILSVLAATL
jgi:hypothetical protein